MRVAIRIIGVVSGATWALLFSTALFLIGGFSHPRSIADFLFAAVPLTLSGAAFWFAFSNNAQRLKVALTIEMLLLVLGIFLCFIVVAASEG